MDLAEQHMIKTVAILGAGSRGAGFGKLIERFGHLGKVVAVAEPRDEYRRSFAEHHQIPATQVFRTWQEFCEKPRMADAVVIPSRATVANCT